MNHHLHRPRSLLRAATCYLQLAGVGDGDGLLGGAAGGADLLDGLDNVETLDDLAEDDVLSVQPRGLDGADEELRTIGTLSVSACGANR
jgi:hypothetical protein